MKAIAIERSASTATVMLKPSWLELLFGAPILTIDLERKQPPEYSSKCGWVSVHTGRAIEDLDFGVLMRDAIDFVVIDETPLPEARLLRSGIPNATPRRR